MCAVFRLWQDALHGSTSHTEGHHTVLVSGTYVEENLAFEKTWIGFNIFLQTSTTILTQELSAVNTVYHIKNSLFPNRYIASALDNLEMAATTDQSHVGQLMEKICQLMDTNRILGEQLKQYPKTNACLDRQGQEDKKATNNNDS